MNPLDRLAEYFKDFPGIGRRQAKRFAYHVLKQTPEYVEQFIHSLQSARDGMRQDPLSFQYFFDDGFGHELSPIMRDLNRDQSQLMIVEKDADIEHLEKTKLYRGHYFVLGGLAPLLTSDLGSNVRIQALFARIKNLAELGTLKEIIFALPAHPEGDRTTMLLRDQVTPLTEKTSIIMTTLGRGMSTGSEIEYVDSHTLEEALKNRHA